MTQERIACQIASGETLTPPQRAEALRLVLGDSGDEAATEQANELLAANRVGEISLAGLFAAYREQELMAAVWALAQPGKTALVWPVRGTSELPEEMADRLMTAAWEYVNTSGIRLAQAALADATGPDAQRLIAHGFFHAADLLYLASTDKQFPTTRPTLSLKLDEYAHADEDRLARLIERTYEQTRDCPQLNGIRAAADVLEGYRATGVFAPQRWLIVSDCEEDLGCLLLADHPTDDQWELVYVGVTTPARGRGLGLALTRHAQWLTGQAGRSRLVLAVDARNEPALAIYLAAGFTPWDRRSVLLRVFETA